MASTSNPCPAAHQAPTTENSDFDSSCSLYEEHSQQLEQLKIRKTLLKSKNLLQKVRKGRPPLQRRSRTRRSLEFTKYNEPLVEVVDGVEKVVGSTQRCSCNYCGTSLACDSRGNGTSTLRKHIEIVCKSYPDKVDIEEGGQQILTKNSTMVDGVRTLDEIKYPTLAIVARDILAIQVSTVASESRFSTGKRVIDPHRSSMTPKTVEALICLQNWLKSDSVMELSYLPTVEEIEFYEDVEKEQLQEEREQLQKTTSEQPTSACGKVVSTLASKKSSKSNKKIKR
ncbi:hypothetical protein OROHE_000621 [Orobanche hederae]